MKKLHLICNSHIDPVWLWTYDEGISAAISTIIDLCQPKNNDKGNNVVYKKGNTEVVEYSRNYSKG